MKEIYEANECESRTRGFYDSLLVCFICVLYEDTIIGSLDLVNNLIGFVFVNHAKILLLGHMYGCLECL